VPPTSTTIAGTNGARVVPLPVSRGLQGGDSVGVSRAVKDWVTTPGSPIATAPVTEEMQRIGSALHCPVALATGPIDVPSTEKCVCIQSATCAGNTKANSANAAHTGREQRVCTVCCN
jgi:hypothetical protein